MLLLASCSKQVASEASSKAEALPAASVVRVTRSAIASRLRVAGQFIPYQEVDLHAKVSGYVRRINVDIGDRVHAGQIIAVLEVPELDAQLAGAKAEVRHTESEIARAQSEVTRAESTHVALHAAYTRLQQAADQRPGLVAQQELDDARAKDQNSEAQIEVATATVEAARQQLGVSKADNLRVQTLSGYSVVTAPFNGVVTMRYADVGSLIQAGTASNTQSMPVVRLAQSDLLRLRMPIPESDVAFIKSGSQVRVHVATLKRSWSAKIVRFARALDMSTRTMTAEVDVSNPDLTLSPGMFAETEIDLEQHGSTLNVPAEALIRDGDQAHLLIVNRADQVENRSVITGIEGDNRIEILSGVSAGESVIVSGQASYQPGQHVRPQSAPEVSL
jgi:RND family efflux transporter MFP subunit